jgi:hypothetical protein
VRAFLGGLRAVRLLVVVVGLALWGFSAVKNALTYTEVLAQVERVEEMCRPSGVPIQEATNCVAALANSKGKRLIRHRAVHVLYKSPADGQEHKGVVIPAGSKMAARAANFRRGDHWKILAHDSKPDDIKAE